MSLQTDFPQTARILDFVEYRLHRLAQGRTPSLTQRRFVWGWPTTGQFMLVDFPRTAPAATRTPALTHSF